MAKHRNSEAAFPFSIRLTVAEKAVIQRCAGSEPLGVYIRRKLLNELSDASRSNRRHVTADAAAMAQVLGLLGKERLASSLSQLAAAANAGSLPLSPETEFLLRRAFADVAAMRGLLMRALGVSADDLSERMDLAATFAAEAAGDAS